MRVRSRRKSCGGRGKAAWACVRMGTLAPRTSGSVRPRDPSTYSGEGWRQVWPEPASQRAQVEKGGGIHCAKPRRLWNFLPAGQSPNSPGETAVDPHAPRHRAGTECQRKGEATASVPRVGPSHGESPPETPGHRPPRPEVGQENGLATVPTSRPARVGILVTGEAGVLRDSLAQN